MSDLQLGIGDLLWESNLGDQYVEDHTDNFYYSDDIEYIYCKQKIQENDKLRILSKDLNDETNKLIGRNVSWEILSTYILHKKNICKNKLKVLIFYDSFLTSSLSLYLDLFEEVYMVKEIYNNSKKKDKQVSALIAELKPLIQNIGDAPVVVPLIKEYLEIGVKNDEHLIKMMAVIQRMNNNAASGGGDSLLTDEELKQLQLIAEEVAKDEQKPIKE